MLDTFPLKATLIPIVAPSSRSVKVSQLQRILASLLLDTVDSLHTGLQIPVVRKRPAVHQLDQRKFGVNGPVISADNYV